MSPATVLHTAFTIDRQLRLEPARAFRFWSEPALKAQWTACHPDWRVVEDAIDFRVGGIEAKRWRLPDGSEQTFSAYYLDIVVPDRIVYGFEMSLGGVRLSASLATVELRPDSGRTLMKYTEQIAFFGSRAGLDERIAGTGLGFARLVDLCAAGMSATN